jgi:integrase
MGLADLRGKGGRVRTVAIPVWVKHGINAWMIAAKIEDGRLLRPLSKSGKLIGDELGDWAIWSVVEQCAKEIGIEHFGAHDLRRTCAKLCRKMAAIWNRSSSYLGIAPFKRRNDILVRSRTWLLLSTIIWGCEARMAKPSTRVSEDER